jgi:uncharacterized membrane protein YphA (DoxX/SURF4 family)
LLCSRRVHADLSLPEMSMKVYEWYFATSPSLVPYAVAYVELVASVTLLFGLLTRPSALALYVPPTC